MTLEQPEQVRRRAAAQARALAAGEHGGQVARLDARRAVPDAVHAPVLAQQSTGAHAVADLLRRDTRAQKLRARHHAVLTRRELPHHHRYRGRLGVHMTP
jgi:hypothetical protein